MGNQEDDDRREVEELYEKILGELSPSLAGAKVSKRERVETRQEENRNLIYGELGFQAVHDILEHAKGEILVDLGSGAGKALVAAALLHPFTECIGVEILEGLHCLATELKKQFDATNHKTRLTVHRGDILTFDVSVLKKADVVIIHCSCFTDHLMTALTKRLATHLKSDAVVATVARSLRSPAFEPLTSFLTTLDGGFDALINLVRKV